MKTKARQPKYRVQVSECAGVYRNAYRRGLKWTAWRTVLATASLDEAREARRRHNTGIVRAVVMLGRWVAIAADGREQDPGTLAMLRDFDRSRKVED